MGKNSEHWEGSVKIYWEVPEVNFLEMNRVEVWKILWKSKSVSQEFHDVGTYRHIVGGCWIKNAAAEASKQKIF